MVIKIAPNEKGNPPGKLAEAELHFTEGALEGLKLVGFAVWERRSGNGRNVTFPSRQYVVNGERRSFALTGFATWCCRLMPSTNPSSRPWRSEACAATSGRTKAWHRPGGMASEAARHGPAVVLLIMRRRRSRTHGCYHVFCGRRRRWS